MKQSHQNSALFCESDLYALMQPDVRKRLALSDEVDFPALRGQFHGGAKRKFLAHTSRNNPTPLLIHMIPDGGSWNMLFYGNSVYDRCVLRQQRQHRG